LNLLDEFGARATFFVLGSVADAAPELVRKVAERGHEIASKGYYHRGVREMGSEFREDLARSREALQRATGQPVLGYRVAERWLPPTDLSMLDVLAQDGYIYDSSIKPTFRAYAREPWRRYVHQHHAGPRSIWEFPLSTVNVLGLDVPIAGGNHFRQFPHAWIKRAVAEWDRTCDAPLVMYFHTWELDPSQPRISTASILAQIRQYRNLDRMEAMLRDYLGAYAFESIADHLGIARSPADMTARGAIGAVAAGSVVVTRAASTDTATPVSVVVPCYNEEAALPYLANTIAQMDQELAGRYLLRFILVDDGSTDRTWDTLQRLFGSQPNRTLIRQGRNQGISMAILTGLRAADTEIVCSIDCDCTYDPRRLEDMIPLLADGVDLVTASPYHPLGSVKNVQGWRLALSRSASHFYRIVLRQKLNLRDPGYLGLVELIGTLDLAGRTIVEYPTMLEARLLGRSKMKVLQNVLRHLGQIGWFGWRRLTTAGTLPSSNSRAAARPRPNLQHSRRAEVVTAPKSEPQG
jgi:polysaccharide deacetylase family protein (PEP-CTERM system associated)